MLVISKDEDAIKDHSGITKAYFLADRKSVKLRFTPFGPFPEGRIRRESLPRSPGAAFKVRVKKWVKLSEFH